MLLNQSVGEFVEITKINPYNDIIGLWKIIDINMYGYMKKFKLDIDSDASNGNELFITLNMNKPEFIKIVRTFDEFNKAFAKSWPPPLDKINMNFDGVEYEFELEEQPLIIPAPILLAEFYNYVSTDEETKFLGIEIFKDVKDMIHFSTTFLLDNIDSFIL